MINNIINSRMIVILPVINLGVSFMSIYRKYKIIYIYEEKMGEFCQVNRVVPSLDPILSNILLL